MPIVLLFHVPPSGVLISVSVLPAHNSALPRIGVGEGFTVMIRVALQPADMLYDIKTVPAPTPVTNPEALMVATDGLLLLHVPPTSVVDSVPVAPSHNGADSPVIAAGAGFTDIVILLLHPPGSE
jgi:hypothetical protein